MATVNWSSANLKTFGDNVNVVTWGPLTTANAEGQPFEMPGWSDRSVHVVGTFGATATLAIQGSNEPVPTNWATLSAAGDPAEDMTFLTAEGNDIKQMLEICRWVRPVLTGGDGTTSLTVLMAIGRGK